MTRALALGLGALVAAMATTTGATAQDRDLDSVEIRATPLGGGVTMLRGAGGNLAVSVGADGALLVDSQFAPLVPKILAAIHKLAGGPPRFVVDTHWHEDHTGGNESLGAAGALLLAHDAVRTRMSSEQFIEAFGRKTPPSPPGALPVLTYSESITFHWNGDEIHAFHVPNAHTDGDTIVHFRRADVLHMGDVFFTGSYPFIDIWSGGSLEGMIRAVEKALPLAGGGTKIIPGHGTLAIREDLVAYLDMLTTVRDRLRRAIDEGLDEETALARAPTREFEALYGGGIYSADSFVRIAYRSLRGVQ